MFEITLSPVTPNVIYQLSEDGEKWQNIEVNEKGSVLREFEPNRNYYFRIKPKSKKRTRKVI